MTAGLLIAEGTAAGALIFDYVGSGPTGRAYDAGATLGGVMVGGASIYRTRFSITGEISGPSGIINFSGFTKFTNPFRTANTILGNISAAFSQGPDLLGGGLALAGASGNSLIGIGKGNCH